MGLAAAAVTEAWRLTAVADLLLWWVVPPALVAAAAARFWPTVWLQMSRAYQVKIAHSMSSLFEL